MKNVNLNLVLSQSAKLWLFFAFCMVSAGGLGYHFWSEKWTGYSDESKRLDGEVRKQKGQLRQILAQKQRLADLEAEIEQANQEFAKLKEMFPDEEAIPRRLIDLTAVTRRSQTLPTKFLPLQSEEKEFYRENRYAVTLSSSYHGLGTLFAEIANFRYPTAINRMVIAKADNLDTVVAAAREHGEIPKTLTATFELTTFTSKK